MPTPYSPAGDTDANGSLEIADAVRLMRWLAECEDARSLSVDNADLDFDGQVTLNDLCLLLDKLTRFN